MDSNNSEKERRHTLVGPAALWKMKRDFQINFLLSRGMLENSYTLDVGCGTLRGGIPLIEYLETGRYYGIEVRDFVLDEGRQELVSAGLEFKNPTLIHQLDISQLILMQQFDYVWAFSVLIHMNDETLEITLDFISKHLSYDGAFYANVNIGWHQDGNWQGFPVVYRSMEFYEDICTKHGLNVSSIGPLRDHGHITNVMEQDSQMMLEITRA